MPSLLRQENLQPHTKSGQQWCKLTKAESAHMPERSAEYMLWALTATNAQPCQSLMALTNARLESHRIHDESCPFRKTSSTRTSRTFSRSLVTSQFPSHIVLWVSKSHEVSARMSFERARQPSNLSEVLCVKALEAKETEWTCMFFAGMFDWGNAKHTFQTKNIFSAATMLSYRQREWMFAKKV
jgi:hypothetical protein